MTRFILLIILLLIPATGTATPLHHAAVEGHPADIKLLIDAGANVNATGKDGRTPRDAAEAQGHHAIIPLLEKGTP